jgi:putative inorganic carbon (hco3(-)) transporter
MHEDVVSQFFPPTVSGRVERLALLFLAGAIASSMLSIVVSELLLAGALAVSIRGFDGWKRVWKGWPVFAWPMIAFCAWTLLAALVSSNVSADLHIVRKFYWFAIPPAVMLVGRAPGSLLWMYRAVFAAAVLASARGLTQFVADPGRDLLHRISGFMGHWMTYSGTLELVVVALAAYGASLGVRKRSWLWAVGFLLLAPLYLSETRSAWLGAVAGLAVVFSLLRPKALAVLVVAMLAILLMSPTRFWDRLRSGWNPDDPNTANRIELVGTSGRLIQAHPWFGVGPKSVGQESLKYRGNDKYPDWMYQHMHNNFLQIAAERGIPGLLLWIWLIGRFGWDAWVLYRRASGWQGRAGPTEPAVEAVFAATASLGGIAALLVSGLFEYNFGDSEVLCLFLFVVAGPYAADFSEDAAHPDTNPTPAIAAPPTLVS